MTIEQIRSFIAIELPDELKAEIDALEAQLKTGKPSNVRWVAANSIHLTLKFLGDISVSSTGDITAAIESAAGGIRPFQLEVKGLGAFPNLRRVQVAWAGLSGDIEPLLKLQKNIDTSLEPLGFIPETRSFTAHLTLARMNNNASPAERERFGQIVAGTRFEAVHAIKVETVSLIRSQLTRAGAIYSRVNTVGLKKG